MTGEVRSTVTANVPREVNALRDVMLLVDEFFEGAPADGPARFAIELALEEIFINVVKYNAAGQGPIAIALDRLDGEVVVTITDSDAPRFDPVADAPQADVTGALADREPGGLGIHLVKKLMDRIEYSHQHRTGTIRLHKRTN